MGPWPCSPSSIQFEDDTTVTVTAWIGQAQSGAFFVDCTLGFNTIRVVLLIKIAIQKRGNDVRLSLEIAVETNFFVLCTSL